jgi:hypothetical protein
MNRLNDLNFRVNIFENNYLIVKFIIHFFIVRFESIERRRNRKKNKLIRKIKDLQNRVISFKSRIADSENYIDERLEEAPKIIKYIYTGVRKESIKFNNLNYPDQEQPKI